LSKSKLFSYQWCPQQFAFKYIDKIEPTVKGTAMTIGRNFHVLFELYFSEVELHNGMNALECTEEIRRALLYVATPMSGDLESYIDFRWATPKDYWKVIQTFIDLEAARASLLSPDLIENYYYPLLLEKSFKVRKIKFRGIIDRMDYDPSETYTIIDYKTGNIGKNVSKMRKELCWYAMGAKELGYDVTYGSIFFVRHGEIFLEKLKKVSMTYALRTIQSVRDSIDEGIFPCRVGHWCVNCGFKDICGYDEELK